MRRFFIFLFISFASLFFSQCEIGKISFALEDVLTFFKVEWKYKKNKIQKIDHFEIKAAKRQENIIQMVDQMIVLKEPRPKNVVQNINKMTILKQEKPENIIVSIDKIGIKTDEKPENEIQQIDEILIEEKKGEALQIVTVDNLLFSKKEQQKKTNEFYKAENFKILCAKKKNQNTIETKENFQIRGKESAEVIELRQNADSMRKALQKYEGGCNEVFKVIHEDGMGEIPQIKDPKIAIPKIIEIVREKAKKNMMKEGKINEDDILDTNRIEEIMKANNDFKSERGKTKKKFSGFKENLKNFGEELSKFGTEHKKVIDENKVLRDELAKIKAASNKGVDLKRDVKNGINSQGQKEENGNNEPETPSFKNNKLKKYQESEIILSQDNTQKKNSRGYSSDKYFIDEPNEIKEEPQSMLSSISRRMNFRSSSWPQNNRNSFPSFFDWKKFYTDPRQQKMFIYDDIYDISQEKVPNKAVLKEDKNIITNIKECHEISLQFQNKNAGVILNNVDENETRQKLGESENKIFKKIDIKGKKDNKIKTRKSYGGITAGNISKDAIARNNRTTVFGSNENVIKEGLKDFKISKLNVAKPLFSHSSFNTSNNKSNTSLSNSGMYSDKFGGKNIINNSFEQKGIKNNLGMLEKNEKKDNKRLSYLGGVKGDVFHNFKKQTEIKNDLLKKKETTKSSLPQKNNAGDMAKVYAKNRALQQQKKTSGAHQENQKVPRQNIINRLKENNAVRKDEKKDLKEEEETKMLRIKTSTNVREKIEKSVIGKNSENRNNNSNSFASLGEKRKSINLNEGRLKGEKNDIKKGDNRENNLQGDKKVPTKTSLLDRFKKKEIKKKE